MKNMCYVLSFLLTMVTTATFSQSMIGVTGKSDTSYNTRIAYQQVIKTHPQSKAVNEFHFNNVNEERNITIVFLFY